MHALIRRTNFPWYVCRLAALLIAWFVSTRVQSEEWSLAKEATIRTANVEEGRKAVRQRDAFIKRMSPLDRALRMKTDQPVSEEQFLRHSAAQVREFSDEDAKRLDAVFGSLLPKLARWKLPWPKTVLLVKTTGQEEAGAAYCRGAAVVLPEQALKRPAERLKRLLAHELFHVLSNQNPAWRKRLYALVGFQPCKEIAYPERLAPRRLTNPDAPASNYFTTVKLDGQPAHVIPVLYATQANYDPAKAGNLFSYLVFRLMVVEPHAGEYRPAKKDGQPILLDAAKTPSYFDSIGKNTSYIIHPEEVLADNFMLLVTGKRDVPTPRILEGLEEVFASQSE